jgi:hypothetical protein
VKHGTYGGYQAHRRLDETACGPCLRANSNYKIKQRSTGVENARERALRRLARLHPSEFRRLYYAELRRSA